MLITIEKWYDRVLIFLVLNVVTCAFCYTPYYLLYLSDDLDNPLGLLPWVCIPLASVVVIGITIKQTIQRMGILRFLIAFIVVLVVSCLAWAVLLFVLFFILDTLTSWGVVSIILVLPLLTLWTPACFMLLALWPFTPKSNNRSKRWSKIISFLVNGPSKYNKKPT